MARTLIQNVSGYPLTLPFPYRGSLQAGASIVVSDDAATVMEYLGGERAVLNLWAIAEVAAGNQLSAAAIAPNDAGGERLVNLAEPVADTDAATKLYVDTHAGPGGGVQSVTAPFGSPIMVDNADPQNPSVYIDQGAIGISAAQVSGLGTAALVNVPVSGDASATEAVLGNDTRLLAALVPSPAGTYANASVTVDDAGRVTSASAGLGAFCPYDVSFFTPGVYLASEKLIEYVAVRDFALATPSSWAARLGIAPSYALLQILVKLNGLNVAVIDFNIGSQSPTQVVPLALYPLNIAVNDVISVHTDLATGGGSLSMSMKGSVNVAALAPYDFMTFKVGEVAAGEFIALWVLDRDVTLQSLQTFARAVCYTPPTNPVTFPIFHSLFGQVGVLTVDTGGACSFIDSIALPAGMPTGSFLYIAHGGGGTYGVGNLTISLKGEAA